MMKRYLKKFCPKNGYLKKIEQLPLEQRWRQVRAWMDTESLSLYEELRESCPVLELPELTIVTRFSDCTSVLRQYDVFSVALYKPKQSDFWMSQDDTAIHWREKAIMRSVLDLEQLASTRQYVAAKASSLLHNAQGTIDAVGGLCRAVSIAFVQEQFGFDESDPNDLFEWSYWSQYDAFHNQAFDSVVVKDPTQIVANREAAGQNLGAYLIKLIQRRGAELKVGKDNNDPATRLLKLSMSGALEKFDPARVIRNLGGLLIGTVETTSHAAINALVELFERPEILKQAIAAAQKDDPSEFDGYVLEALRFNPSLPYFFRVCEQETQLATGTDYARTIKPGTTVIAITHSAMFDETAFLQPQVFDPTRPETNTFHFGQGLHECLGRHIGRQMITEIVRQVLLLPGVKAVSKVDYKGGPFPEEYRLEWCHEE
ncbi:cytochrome P450 [Leptothoe sp. ISB3NOV94-8A]